MARYVTLIRFMPDDYEMEYGFNPNDPSDILADANGDGMSNLALSLSGVANSSRRRGGDFRS